jgi:hypothetical protein
MARIYDQARIDTAASAIADELRAVLTKARPRLTPGEAHLAKLKALHLIGLEMVDAMTTLARETTPAMRRLEQRGAVEIDDEGEVDAERI